MTTRALGWRAGYLAAAAALFLADQASKAWAVRALRYGRDVTLVPRVLDLTYAENTGIAFGQLQDGGDFTRWMLVGLACAAALAVLVYLFRTARTDDRVLGACALLLAGITGNLADPAICTGAFLLALDLFIEGRRVLHKTAARSAL